jgi:hypothetical protein
MELVIATADSLDAENILRLQYFCYQVEASVYGDYSIPPLTQTLESLLEELASHRVLIARMGPDIVGSVRACANETGCHLGGSLFIHACSGEASEAN